MLFSLYNGGKLVPQDNLQISDDGMVRTKGEPPYRHVFMVGKGHNIKNILNAIADKNLQGSYCVIGDGKRDIQQKTLTHALTGNISKTTHVYLHGHGNREKDSTHRITLVAEQHNVIDTILLLEELSSDKHLHSVALFSCFGGSAVENYSALQKQKPRSNIIVFAPKHYTTNILLNIELLTQLAKKCETQERLASLQDLVCDTAFDETYILYTQENIYHYDPFTRTLAGLQSTGALPAALSHQMTAHMLKLTMDRFKEEQKYQRLFEEFLARHPEKKNAPFLYSGDTLLTYCITINQYQLGKWLIEEEGVNPNAEDMDGRNPLSVAILLRKDIAWLKLLLPHCPNIDACSPDGYNLLHNTVFNQDMRSATVLLQYGADPEALTKMKRPPIFDAVDNNDREMVQLLLSYGANIEARNNRQVTLLEYAKRKAGKGEKEKEIYEILLEEKEKPSHPSISPKSSKNIALFNALFIDEDYERAEHLVTKGADINALYSSRCHNNSSLLHLTINSNNPDQIAFLLRHNVQANTHDDRKNTPLYIAVARNKLTMVETLLKSGKCDINSKNSTEEEPPLHRAVYDNNMPMVEILLEHGANPTSTNKRGEDALKVAKTFRPENKELLTLLETKIQEQKQREAAAAQAPQKELPPKPIISGSHHESVKETAKTENPALVEGNNIV